MRRLSLVQPVVRKCASAVLEPGTTKVRRPCGNPTTEFICDACWDRVTPLTRRAFNDERNRLRKVGNSGMTQRMRELLKRVVIESAREDGTL